MTTLNDDWNKAVAHYGVQGMKWGVRKDASRADKSWGKKAYSDKTYRTVNNRGSERINAMLGGFNKKHANKDLSDPKQLKEYEKAFEKEANKIFNEELEKVVGRKSPSGKYSVKAVMNMETGWMAIAPGNQDMSKVPVLDVSSTSEIKQSDESEDSESSVLTYFRLIKDDNGFVTSIEESSPSMKQSSLEEDWERAVVHYGKKGMKWGVRKSLGKYVEGRMQRRADLQSAYLSNYKKQTTQKDRARVLITKELDHTIAKRSKIDVKIYDNDPPKVKRGKMAIQGVAAGMMLLQFAALLKAANG